jgi:hypothetical protein
MTTNICDTPSDDYKEPVLLASETMHIAVKATHTYFWYKCVGFAGNL